MFDDPIVRKEATTVMMKQLVVCISLLLISATAAHGVSEAIRWMDYAQGTTLARSQDKKAIVYFHTSWCPSCKKMEAETFPRPEVIRMISEGFVAIRVDADAHQDIAGTYGVTGVPELWLIHPDATPIGNVTGFIPANRLLKILEYQRR